MMSLPRGSVTSDYLDRDGVPLFRNGPQRELISWRFPSSGVPIAPEPLVDPEHEKTSIAGFSSMLWTRRLPPVFSGRPLLLMPIMLFFSYMTVVFPATVVRQLPFLLPGWAGLQAGFQKPDFFVALPEGLSTDTVLWQIPFSLSFSFPFASFQEAPWVQAWRQWWEGEFRLPTLSHYMFEAPAAVFAQGQNSYMFQDDPTHFVMAPTKKLTEIHQPVTDRVVVKETKAPQKFVKQAVEPRALGFKSELKAARLALIGNDPQGAIQILRSIPSASLLPDHLSVLASAYQMAGDHERSIQAYGALLRLQPEEGRAWVGLSVSLEAMHDSQNAIIGYRKALEYPLDPKIRAHVEHRLHRLGA